MPSLEKHEIISKAEGTLESGKEQFQQSSEFFSQSPEDKIKLLPNFAAKMNNRIQSASVFIKMLDNTEWNSRELEEQANTIKKELGKVRTRLRTLLRQELEKNLEQSLAQLRKRLPRAKRQNQAGSPLEYVSILEEFAHLQIAKKITTPSLYAQAMKTVFAADIESEPESIKDYGVHIDDEVLQNLIAADKLTRYRKLLEKGDTTSEQILASKQVKALEESLLG